MKRSVAAFTLALLLFAPLGRVVQAGQTDADKHTAKIKADIARRIADKNDRVKIRLRDGREIDGRLDHANEMNFTVLSKTAQPTQISYGDVAKISGKGLSRTSRILIIGGVAVVVVAIVGYISVRNADYFRGGIRVP